MATLIHRLIFFHHVGAEGYCTCTVKWKHISNAHDFNFFYYDCILQKSNIFIGISHIFNWNWNWYVKLQWTRICGWSQVNYPTNGCNGMLDRQTDTYIRMKLNSNRWSAYLRQAEQITFCISLIREDLYLDPDLNQNLISLFLSSPPQLLHVVLS